MEKAKLLQHKSVYTWLRHIRGRRLAISLCLGLALFISACNESQHNTKISALGSKGLLMSEAPNRSNGKLLDGSSVSEKIYVFLHTEGEVKQVDFYLDDPQRTGTPYGSERQAFYDFAGTSANGQAIAFDTTMLANGLHSITAITIGKTGEVTTSSASFTIKNEKSTLWTADHEKGNLSQWTKNQGGQAVFNSGTGQIKVTDTFAHSGRYSLALTVRDANNDKQGARIFRWYEDLQSGYYSAWYYFPQRFEPKLWWNVFQFKTHDRNRISRPAWSLNVDSLENGEMTFYLYDSLKNRAYDKPLTSTPLPIPVGQWVHVEAFYRRATDDTGCITVWQDGTKIYDISGVRTALTDYTDWSLNNYTSDIRPSTATIYVDDAAISTSRLGPNH